jgi:outer membrane protein W
MIKHVSNMVKVNKLLLLSVFIIAFCALQSKAQTACTQTLRQARTVFDEGRIHEIEGLLEGCIKDGLSDDERTEAYRLLILSYIYLDETDKADNAMLALLKDNHAYEINETADPTELINLYRTFRTKPIFFWGFKLGAGTTFVNVINNYGLNDANSTFGKYGNTVGIEGGLMFEKILFNRIAAHADLSYNSNSFTYENNFLNESDGNSLIEHLSTETQTSLGFSLMGQYLIKTEAQLKKAGKKVRLPYVGIGATLKYITSSDLAAETDRDDGGGADGAAEDLIGEGFRKQLNPTVDIEAGYKIKSKLSFINLSVRYSYGLLNLTDKHYDNGRLSTFYGWAANDISTHFVTVSVGYLIPQYSPKKLIK